MLNIVLVEPEIPMNTGNIARTCAATGSVLHLVEPLGFSISDKAVKRAGLDYWHLVDIRHYKSFAEFCDINPDISAHYATTKAPRSHSSAEFRDGDFILFGKETRGLDVDLLRANYDKCIRIPMISDARSLNLSNSVAIVLYEALRQLDYPGLNHNFNGGVL